MNRSPLKRTRSTLYPASISIIVASLISGCAMQHEHKMLERSNAAARLSINQMFVSMPIEFPGSGNPAIVKAEIQQLNDKGDPIGQVRGIAVMIGSINSGNAISFGHPKFSLHTYGAVGQTAGSAANPTKIIYYTLYDMGPVNQSISGSMVFPYSPNKYESDHIQRRVSMGGIPYDIEITAVVPPAIKKISKARLRGSQRFPDE